MKFLKRRLVIFPVFLAAVFALTACNSLSKTDSLGNEWSDDWVSMGFLLGIDKKAGDLDFAEQNDALSLNGIDYAKWAYGEPEKYVGEEGEDVDLYPAEAYVLLREFSNEGEASSAIEEWKALEAQSYDMSGGKSALYGEQEFEVFSLAPKSESPYVGGFAAFAKRGGFAFSVELMFTEKFDGNADEILKGFLESFHYRAENES